MGEFTYDFHWLTRYRTCAVDRSPHVAHTNIVNDTIAFTPRIVTPRHHLSLVPNPSIEHKISTRLASEGWYRSRQRSRAGEVSFEVHPSKQFAEDRRAFRETIAEFLVGSGRSPPRHDLRDESCTVKPQEESHASGLRMYAYMHIRCRQPRISRRDRAGDRGVHRESV